MQKARKSINQYIIFNKPYGVLSQFTREHGHESLADYGPFPPSVYPVGRLDADSEGLIFLTDDKVLTHRLASPQFDHPKTYAVQVERIPEEKSLQKLAMGVVIDGKKTKPADVRLLQESPNLPERKVPIRFRKTVPTAWITITLREGRNRQVRKMTAAIGHPTLRLVRVSIGPINLGNLTPGSHRNLTADELVSIGALRNPGRH